MNTPTTHVLIFGAGEAGKECAQRILENPDSAIRPTAFLDDNLKLKGTAILGIPVVGNRVDLAAAATETGSSRLLIAMPSASTEETAVVSGLARDAGLEVEVLAPYSESLTKLLLTTATTAEWTDSKEDPDASTVQFDLAVVGLGYVGLPVAVEAALVGMSVLGFEVDLDKVKLLTSGKSHIEDISDGTIKKALANGLQVSANAALLSNARAISISVPTPLKDGLPDLGAVIAASNTIGAHLQPGQLVILESTTYPGTTEEIVLPILEERSGLTAGIDFQLAYSPERIDPGNKTWTLTNTPKVVGGHTQKASEMAAAMYGQFCDTVVPLSGTREAEMSKLIENTYRHVNIALMNEMAIFCRPLGVDLFESIRGAATKPFGFQAFYPGPGVGGHCIPIDPGYLSYRVRQLGEQFRFVELATEINNYMPKHVVVRAEAILRESGITISGAKVMILGVAYKPDVSDMRETPATEVIASLWKHGAEVVFCDPHVSEFSVDGRAVLSNPDVYAAAADADLVILHTPHSEFDLESIAAASSRLLDTRGVLPLQKAYRI